MLRNIRLNRKPKIFLNPTQHIQRTHIAGFTTYYRKLEANQQYEFKTETSKLLDIVANSLYSEKEVFIRELISNAADATEKLKHLQLVKPEDYENANTSSEISIELDKENRIFTIKDRGIGLTLEELHQNLGTIAASGSKKFIEELKSNSKDNQNIIGQFGVGFYSGFMVSKKMQVFTKSAQKGAKGYCWTSDGINSYSVDEVPDLEVGTTIKLYLKNEQFLEKDKVISIIKKYSNFVGIPIKLEDQIINETEPLWNKNANQITPEEHEKFYQSITNNYDKPYYSMAYKTDAPISIKAIFYISETSNEMNTNNEFGVTLYSRNVMISNKSNALLPYWLRFVKGVVDSEDIPLNLSREMLQNGILINKLKTVLTNRIIKWIKQETKDEVKYEKFYKNYHRYFKEATILEENQNYRNDIIPLLRFETSNNDNMIDLETYKKNMKPEQKSIYYSCSNKFDMNINPYYEPFKKNEVEVLFLNDAVDKVLANVIQQYDGIPLVDIESTVANEEIAKFNPIDEQKEGLNQENFDLLSKFIIDNLGAKLAIKQIELAKTITSFPMLAVGHQHDNDPYMRQLLKQSLAPGQTMPLVPIVLQMSNQHNIVKGLFKLIEKDNKVAIDVCEQLINNARVIAGLSDDVKPMISKMNSIIEELVTLKSN